MSCPRNSSTAYLSMPASMSAASCGVSGLRKSTPETSPKKCGWSCRIETVMAFLLIEPNGCPARLPEKLRRDPAMSTPRHAWRWSGIAGHQAAIDRNDGAGQERGRRQAQAQRHVGDFFRVAVAAERGAPPGIDRLVLVIDPRRHAGGDRA